MARITGKLRTITSQPALARLKIVPRSVPTVDGEALIFPEEMFVTPDLAGAFEVDLVVGEYEFWVGNARVIVSVPDDENTYSVEQRIVSAVTPPTPPVGGAQPTASAAALGIIKAENSEVSPVAVLGWFVRTNVAAARTIAGKASNKMLRLTTPGAHELREWWYDSASLAVDDGTSATAAVKPSDVDGGSPGRWLPW